MSKVALNINPPKKRASKALDTIDQPIQSNEYFGTTSDQNSCVWFYDGSEATRTGVPNPDALSRVAVLRGQTLKSALKTLPMFQGKKFVIHKMALEPGVYYPRIARPSNHHPYDFGSVPNYRELSNIIMSSLNQMRTLVGMLDEVVRTVHPAKKNMKSFGTNIRNLIILACTECEAQWRGAIEANGVVKKRACTNDYVKLLNAMRLKEYTVKLSHFPWLKGISPYQNWEAANATKSINWYNSYNAIKHDREQCFEQATLKTAIDSICALWIMIAAQYGQNAIREFDDLNRYFQLERVPRWRFSEVYTSSIGNGPTDYTPTNFPF